MAETKQVERTEFRVVGDQGGETLPIRGPIYVRTEAERIAFASPGWPAFSNVRVQESVVTETRTPWEDVDDE